MYEYVARVTNVVDGDTVDAVIQLGLKVLKEERLRLAGIDTPEINTKATRVAGMASKDHVVAAILGREVLIRTKKPYTDDKYGRWLASIYYQPGLGSELKIDTNGTLVCLNNELVSKGLATAYDGTGPRA